jgi:hypothetical protein
LAVRKASLADIVRLRAKGHGINQRSVRGKQADGFAALIELEISVQVIVDAVLRCLIISPHEEIRLCRDGCAGGDQPLSFVGEIIC